MSFWIICPGCKAKLQVAEQFRGKVVRCPKCQQTFAAGRAATAPLAPAPGARQPASPTTVATQRAQQEEAPVLPPRKQKGPKPKRAGRNALPWIIAGGVAAAGFFVVALACVVGGWFLLGRQGQAQPVPVAVKSPVASGLPARGAPAAALPVKEAAGPAPSAKANVVTTAAFGEPAAAPSPRGGVRRMLSVSGVRGRGPR
jgi:predicted Zn finger-like uncharacterized protein